MNTRYRVVDDNLVILKRGMDLVATISDEAYITQPTGRASVGSHMRHVLDFFDNFLRGTTTGRIDYDSRAREPEVERNRLLALDRFALVIGALETGEFAPDRDMQVRLDSMLPSSDQRAWSRSTLHRELQGLVSHTIHHYALVAMTLAFQGVDAPSDFGLAPSTVQYRAGQGMAG